MSVNVEMRRSFSTKESLINGSPTTYVRNGSPTTYVRPGSGYVYYEEDLSNGQIMDVTDRYVIKEPARRTVRQIQAPVKTLTSNGSMISVEPSVISIPRQRQEKIVTRVLPANSQRVREVRRVVQSPLPVQQSPVLVQQGAYRTVIDTSRNAIHSPRGVIVSGSPQTSTIRRYVQNPQVVNQVVRRSVPSKKVYVTKSRDYDGSSSSSSSSSDESDEERTIISKGEVVHAVIRDNWTFNKREPKAEKVKSPGKKDDKNDDASSTASSSSLESRKLKILEQVRDNGVENGQVIVNDNGTPVIVKMRSNEKKKEKKSKKKDKKNTEEKGKLVGKEPDQDIEKEVQTISLTLHD